jgi:hypothetical protein
MEKSQDFCWFLKCFKRQMMNTAKYSHSSTQALLKPEKQIDKKMLPCYTIIHRKTMYKELLCKEAEHENQ